MFDLLVPIGYPYLRKDKSGRFATSTRWPPTGRSNSKRTCRPSSRFCLSVSFNSPHAEDGKLDNLYPWPKTVDGWYDDVRIPEPPLVEVRYFRAEPGVSSEVPQSDPLALAV